MRGLPLLLPLVLSPYRDLKRRDAENFCSPIFKESCMSETLMRVAYRPMSFEIPQMGVFNSDCDPDLALRVALH
jgi:hypothetical protein